MDLSEAANLDNDISSHWYYRSKAAALIQWVTQINPTAILDVGAGSAFFSRFLLRHTDAQEAWCVDINYVLEFNDSEGSKPVHYRKAIGPVNCDLVLMMDVLEHVDNDVKFLKDYMEKVPQGTRFVVTVPAFHFLWGAHDVFLQHKRRYSLKQLEKVVAEAGLTIDHSAYFFALVFPFSLVTRFAAAWFRPVDKPSKSQLKLHHPVVNWFLSACCRFELPIMPINRLAGLTVFCVATRT